MDKTTPASTRGSRGVAWWTMKANTACQKSQPEACKGAQGQIVQSWFKEPSAAHYAVGNCS